MRIEHIFQQGGARARETGQLSDPGWRAQMLLVSPAAQIFRGHGFSKALKIPKHYVRMSLKNAGVRALDFLALAHAPDRLLIVTLLVGKGGQSGPGLRAGKNVGLRVERQPAESPGSLLGFA